MRSTLLVLLTVLVATAALADDATLMLRKSGNCSGIVTAVDRDTRQTLASCGFGCTERAADVPVGTRVRVTTQAYGQCGGGIDFVDSSPSLRRTGAPMGFRSGEFQIDASGVVITARFRMSSPMGPGIPSAFTRTR